MSDTWKRDRFFRQVQYAGLRNYPLLRGVPPRFREPVARRFVYDAEFNYFYARVPKAANSAVIDLLQRLSGKAPASILDAKKSLNRWPSKRAFDRAYKFTVVRDPLHRSESAYRDKICGTEPKFRRVLGLQDGASFKEFLLALRSCEFGSNAHFIPQHYLVPNRGVGFDRICKVETLEADLREVANAVFGSVASPLLERVNPSSGQKTNADDTERALVRDLYREDYEAFGYQMPD